MFKLKYFLALSLLASACASTAEDAATKKVGTLDSLKTQLGLTEGFYLMPDNNEACFEGLVELTETEIDFRITVAKNPLAVALGLKEPLVEVFKDCQMSFVSRIENKSVQYIMTTDCKGEEKKILERVITFNADKIEYTQKNQVGKNKPKSTLCILKKSERPDQAPVK